MNTEEKRLNQVKKTIADLERRRAELLTQHNASAAAVRETGSRLGGDLLAQGGSGGAQSSIDFIARERVRLEGLESAKKLADEQIDVLKAEQAEIEKAVLVQTFDQDVEAATKTLFVCIGLLDQFSRNLETIRLVAPLPGYATDKSAMVRNMLGHLSAFDVRRALIEFERIAPAFMAAARKHGKEK